MSYFIWSSDSFRLMKRLAHNHTKAQVAVIIGCSENSVKKKAWREGVSFKKVGENHFSSKTSDIDVERIRAMNDCGMSFAEISKKTKIKLSTVNYYASYRSAI